LIIDFGAEDNSMKIDLEIDDKLLARAKKAAGKEGTQETVEMALKCLIHKPWRMLKLQGKVKFLPGYDHENLRD
jgi:Arc/MetJ family transcription regulator